MKRLILIFVIIIFSLQIWAQSAQSDEMNNAAINATANYLNNICMDALSRLHIIAKTPGALEGDWERIKPYLGIARNSLPGVYFYVLPDGSYYRFTQDFTDKNLSNREYFEPLFAGNDVKGYSIYGRTSGKKSAVVATPIIKDGEVIGALGTSIFLDQLQKRLNNELGLSDNYTWFVVDSDGQIMLDMEEHYIFDNALSMTKSLTEAINEVIKNENGSISYDIDGVKREGLYTKLPDLNWWMIIAKKYK